MTLSDSSLVVTREPSGGKSKGVSSSALESVMASTWRGAISLGIVTRLARRM